MANYYKEEIPMLSDTIPPLENDYVDSQFRAAPLRNRSASISIPMDSLEPPQYEAQLVGFTGPLRRERIAPLPQKSGPVYVNRNGDVTSQPNQERMTTEMVDLKPNGWYKEKHPSKNEHLLKSGQLGMCNDPYCTTCPSYYSAKASQQKHSKVSLSLESRIPGDFYGDAKGWTRRFITCLKIHIPGVMNPHTKLVQRWNKFFVSSCLVAIFVDPLFFFVLSVLKDKKCIVINWKLTLTIVVFRSLTDFIYLLHMLLQFRLAYVAPESRVVGAGELVDAPKKIAMHYFRGFFFLDLFTVLPLPQIIVLLILPENLGSSGANYAKNLLRTAILLQYIPRLFRFLPLLIGQSQSGFIFETARANFVINLLTFVLSGHVVGACWYLFGLQRVNQCLRDACRHSDSKSYCKDFIDCGYGDNIDQLLVESIWNSWKNNENATACFTSEGNFSYGIYNQAINLTTKQNVATRYIYSLFWGFQQISTLAGNQVPSYFIWEVLFTMAIVGLGLLLFAFLIGNMQNFLQALGRRRLEMSLRRRDVEQWMSHRRLPIELRRKVLEAERYNWAATRGVNEEVLLDSIPEDLQRDIRAHLFSFVRQVWIFKQMDDHVLDAICERLKQKIYIKGSKVLHQGGVIDKMLFIVRGKLVSVGEDCTELPLTDGDVCGEELLTWCLDNTSINKDGREIKTAGHRLFSSRTVTCLTNVEAFALRESDIEEVTSLFARNLRHPRIQGAIRYQSPYWRTSAAMRIQVAWRYRHKRLKRGNTSAPDVNY